jgi:hypothetical protein
MDLSDVARGLKDVRSSLERGVLPSLEACATHGGSGCLVVIREVFAYVEFLGALYGGYAGEMDNRRRKIASGQKSVQFLKEFFGTTDAAYRQHARLIYEMFRHGTVHVSRPHILKRRSDSSTIEWACYIGERQGAPICYEGHPLQVDHLRPLLLDVAAKRYIMSLSIDTLYNDLLSVIERYEGEIRKQYEAGDPTLLQHYTSTIKALLEPDETALSW